MCVRVWKYEMRDKEKGTRDRDARDGKSEADEEKDEEGSEERRS